MQPLADKVSLITGGSSGIGRATAVRLAALGAKVAVAARNLPALEEVVHEIKKAGSEGLAVQTDVTDLEQCRAAVNATVTRFGRLDILVASAGLSMRAYFANSDPAALEKLVRVNVMGVINVTHAAIPEIKKTRGSIVALSSLTGLRGVPSYGVYGATKYAVQGLYESLRLELRRDGVHVGVVAPGFVDTPLREHVLGPDGKPWENPPPPPFRIWPVAKCVEKIVDVIVHRRRQSNLPWFMGPLFWLDHIVCNRIGNRILLWKFPPI